MVRRICREEIQAAFVALAASADSCDVPYESDREESAVFDAIKRASDRAASVMVHVKECPSRTSRYGDGCMCWQYGVDPSASADEG